MSYNVYLVAYIGAPRNHHAIFVETELDGSGLVFHVTGNVQSGMQFESKNGKRPENSASFDTKTYLGWVSASNLHYIGETCSSIPPPKKQFQGPKRLYPNEPLRRCQEWTNEAVNALITRGILQTQAHATSSTAQQASDWVWSEEYQNWYQDNGDGTFTWANSEQQATDAGKGKKKSKGKK
ncbi:hypothetical protein NLG97_g346 [Lecanicillium saksenae]|uniref:Uncharacterized protein n=1 Tax=Lecanicillium saksenae TaxID=468837 RepID=A0ACC1R8P7_9HYPO|nr:hypothetical protein NLG97_g346 [Lecanicillium saksenae]